jgi:predicted nucleic acid-binding protein
MTLPVMEDAVLVDSTIAAYALGAEHPLKTPCRRLLLELAEGRGRGYASVEMIQEIVHHRLRRTGDPARAAQDGRTLAAALIVLNFDHEVLDTSLRLIEQLPGVRGRDAVHAATALAYGIDKIASTDTAFDLIPGITRVVPQVS